MVTSYPDERIAYTIRELAYALGIDIRTAKKLVKERQIPTFLVGSKQLVWKDDAITYLSEYTPARETIGNRLRDKMGRFVGDEAE